MQKVTSQMVMTLQRVWSSNPSLSSVAAGPKQIEPVEALTFEFCTKLGEFRLRSMGLSSARARCVCKPPILVGDDAGVFF